MLSILAALLSTPALAAPGFIPVQGVLTDAQGLAIDGQVDVTFTLYSDSGASLSLWTDELTLDVVDGAFSTELGAGVVPLELDTFANYGLVHLEITVAGDSPMPLVPLDPVPYAAYALRAGDSERLQGLTLAGLRAEIPVVSDMEQSARDAAYDTPAELHTELDSRYLPTAYTPDWPEITNRPAGLDDGDDVRSQTEVENWATGVAYDTPTELHGVLDSRYLASSYVPDWSALTNRPAGLDDGDDVRSQTEVENWATGVAYDTPSELHGVLDSRYLSSSYVPDWTALTNRPAGLDDGDDDTQLTEAQVDGFVANNGYAASGDLAAVATTGDYADLVNTTHYFQGSLSTPHEWMADLVFNGNYDRFCEQMGKTLVSSNEVTAHYNPGQTNGYYYANWYYTGARNCDTDTHVYGGGDPTSPYNVWRYSGDCGCCPSGVEWTFERSAFITCE